MLNKVYYYSVLAVLLSATSLVRFFRLYGYNDVGVLHVKIDSNNNGSPDTWVETYCIDKDHYIYDGHTYSGSLYSAPDTTINREVAYILTW